MTGDINQWAIRWNIPHAALVELGSVFGTIPSPISHVEDVHKESYVQNLVRLEAAKKGIRLWRNNVGVLMDATGRPVRYGLANDSPGLNKTIKSGDLIGWRKVLIAKDHVGTSIAQFISRECKRPGWGYTGTDREQAQLKWIQLIIADGGDARFASNEGTL